VNATRSSADRLATVREICLALPESAEKETWGHPTFRVRDKIFTSFGETEDESPVTVVTMKAALGEQEPLLAEGHPFFMPKYVGSKGWIGIVLDDDTDWTEIAEFVEDSYRQIAPKRLSAQLDQDS
jgi:predicted DNA-binding protein (MmcQ/YjbR family)